MSIKELQPIFITNHKIIKFFEIFSPISIGAITLFFLVISKEELSEEVKNHESIHFQQYLELLVLGFLILYVGFWIKGIILGKSGSDSYQSIPFEREAYDKMHDNDYLKNRKRYSWIKYI
jgi:hypothetical protein